MEVCCSSTTQHVLGVSDAEGDQEHQKLLLLTLGFVNLLLLSAFIFIDKLKSRSTIKVPLNTYRSVILIWNLTVTYDTIILRVVRAQGCGVQIPEIHSKLCP